MSSITKKKYEPLTFADCETYSFSTSIRCEKYKGYIVFPNIHNKNICHIFVNSDFHLSDTEKVLLIDKLSETFSLYLSYSDVQVKTFNKNHKFTDCCFLVKSSGKSFNGLECVGTLCFEHESEKYFYIKKHDVINTIAFNKITDLLTEKNCNLYQKNDFVDLILDFCEYNIDNTQCRYSFYPTLKECINYIIEHNSYNAYKRIKSIKNLYLNNINIVNDNGVDFLTFNMGVTLDNKDIIFEHIINFGNLSLKNNTMVGFALDKLDWTFMKDLNNEFRKKFNWALPNNVIEEILNIILDFLTKHYTLSQDFIDKFNFFINNCHEELDIKYFYQCNKQQESIQQMQQQIIELSEMMKSLEERLSHLTAIPNSLINDK